MSFTAATATTSTFASYWDWQKADSVVCDRGCVHLFLAFQLRSYKNGVTLALLVFVPFRSYFSCPFMQGSYGMRRTDLHPFLAASTQTLLKRFSEDFCGGESSQPTVSSVDVDHNKGVER